jgi:hypothetical protein
VHGADSSDHSMATPMSRVSRGRRRCAMAGPPTSLTNLESPDGHRHGDGLLQSPVLMPARRQPFTRRGGECRVARSINAALAADVASDRASMPAHEEQAVDSVRMRRACLCGTNDSFQPGVYRISTPAFRSACRRWAPTDECCA